MQNKLFGWLGLIALGTLAWLVGASEAMAYERYDDGCVECHNFLDNTSQKPGNTWPSSKHNRHRFDMLDGLCGACHLSGDGRNPYLNQSDGEPGLPGLGCVGCHGADPNPGTQNSFWGAGLRLHHANADAPADSDGDFCADCHPSDPLPLPEDIAPAYYGGLGVNITGPCNLDGSENWTSDGLGLDNDGDLDYDNADADCQQVLFSDGFESGDTSAWSSTVP